MNTNSNNGVYRLSSHDRHYCFFIQDFWPGDCIIVRVNKQKVRGIVDHADYDTMKIHYRTAENNRCVASLNDIVLLKPHERGWLFST